MKYLISALLLTLSFTVSAKGITGSFKPSSSAGWRHDVFKVTCGPLASRIRVNIREQLPIQSAIQYIYVASGGLAYSWTYDTTDGDGTISPYTSGDYVPTSSYVYIANYGGKYTNVEFYEGNIECRKPDGTGSETTLQFIQDQ